MENASKALLMAGGVFLTILIVSLLMYAMSSYSEYQQNQIRLAEIEDTAKFNQQFTNYERDDVLGYEVLSLVNKIIDYNDRRSDAIDAQNDEKYKPITLTVTMWDTDDEKNKISTNFAASIEVPSKIGGSNPETIGSNPELFTDAKYIQSKAKREFQTEIMEEIDKIEKKEALGATKKNGGTIKNPTAVQNLVKEKNTIYGGKIIGINGTSEQAKSDNGQGWYDESYIIARYKTLTGKKMNRIDDIRDKDLIEDIAKYYEYMQFKKSIFNCTGIGYDDGPSGTGRVISINFKCTGNMK